MKKRDKSGTVGNLAPKRGTVPPKWGQLASMIELVDDSNLSWCMDLFMENLALINRHGGNSQVAQILARP